MKKAKVGVLLLNLGTPNAPTGSAIRSYLREFLMDPRVIDIPYLFRFILVYVLILPFRPWRVSKAYRSIWTNEGSPLLVETKKLGLKLQKKLGDSFHVEIAMRYGSPSIEAAKTRLSSENVGEIILAPLYPQYASSSTGSCLEKAFASFGREWNVLPILTLPPFYDHSGFIEAFAEQGRLVKKNFEWDHVLFSFHGLPERHLKTPPGQEKFFCYRTQAEETAKLIAQSLSLEKKDYTVCYQSRLGRTPWLQPFTDVVIQELGKKGVQKLAVFCPSFVADCLETLEEISIRGKELFIEAGGKELKLIPSLNDSDLWVNALSEMIRLTGKVD